MTRRTTWPDRERTGRLAPLPHAFALALDRSTRRRGELVVTGGVPAVAARLTADGAAVFEAFAAGATVAAAAATHAEAGVFARWLVDAGLAHPRPPTPGRATVSVVVPARDRARVIERVVRAIGGRAEVVVVDDGSTDGTADAAERAGARVVRRPAPGGPAAARNAGLAATTTDLVGFVDSDCVPEPGWLDALLAHFADPLLALAAPRIVGHDAASGLSRYEEARSILDQGPHAGRVDPFGPVTFVPSAALLVRRAAVVDVGGFDEALHYGEDQDLVWRLAAAGWRMRYEPEARVAHEHRDRAMPFLRRRFGYGTPIATLGRRHPEVVTAARLPAPVAAALAVTPARPWVGASIAGATGLVVADRLRRVGLPWGDAGRLALRWEVGGARTAAAAVTGPWLPVAAVAAWRSPKARVALASLFLARHVNDWRRTTSAVGPLRHVALRAADDAALAAGRWWGALREHTTKGLGADLLPMPAVSSAPLAEEVVVLR